MPIDSDRLAAELRHLRKGRAMRHPHLPQRLGPQIRLAFDIGEHDNVGVIRRKVSERIRELLRNEVIEIKTAALAALGLHPRANQRLLNQRETWLASEFTYDVRTARRRVSAALAHLVDALVEQEQAGHGPEPPRDDGFTVRAMRAVLYLDRPAIELRELRSVVVSTQRLDAIVCRITVPRTARSGSHHEVDTRVLGGGRIVHTDRPFPEHFSYHLELPCTLHHGDRHEYGLAHTLPVGQPMRPHYVFQPLVPCEAFDVTVHFDPSARPTLVWLLNGVPPRQLDDDRPGPDLLTLPPSARISLSFADLRQGLGYGLGWAPATP